MPSPGADGYITGASALQWNYSSHRHTWPEKHASYFLSFFLRTIFPSQSPRAFPEKNATFVVVFSLCLRSLRTHQVLRQQGLPVFQELVENLHLMLDPDWTKERSVYISVGQIAANPTETAMQFGNYIHLCSWPSFLATKIIWPCQ